MTMRMLWTVKISRGVGEEGLRYSLDGGVNADRQEARVLHDDRRVEVLEAGLGPDLVLWTEHYEAKVVEVFQRHILRSRRGTAGRDRWLGKWAPYGKRPLDRTFADQARPMRWHWL